jgi:hypothetical protein
VVVRTFHPGMKGVTMLLAVALLTQWPLARAENSAADEGAKFFELTNLWTIHLTFERSHWRLRESAQAN